MRRLCLTLEYDGTAYCGWQKQPNGPSVQQAVEDALFKLTEQRVRVDGSSRTDAGVHAKGYAAAVTTDSPVPTERFALALNTRLPKDIVVLAVREVEPDFDPRRNAKRKLYRYTLHADSIRPALTRKFVWHVKWPLELAAMQRAAAEFVGTHDFTSFSNQECNQPDANNVRTIDRCEVRREGAVVTVDVEGKSFLYNMVRNMVGTLVDVGTGRFMPEEVARILSARDRGQAGQGAPALGLCLEWVKYDGE